nr:RNA-directed DNA polymerase, eukaryota, reverse transcriptase zinc-binding domain protein [Tanacetum cinerariifolium]
FEARFKKPADQRFKLNFQFHKILLKDQADDLERGVSRDEINRAVWNCGDNKSLSPDGFNFEFFKKYWDVVGSDFCEAIVHFFTSGGFFKGCNSSFVTLILKIIDAKFDNDFRPISLIGDLVSDTQSAFVAGRQILDGPFILDEILKWCKRMGKQAMFFKVDFTKAYDSVRWDYLIDVLEAFGFGRVVEEDLIKRIQLPRSISISHLFYADDAMFIGEWSDNNLKGDRFYWMLNFEQSVSISRRDGGR